MTRSDQSYTLGEHFGPSDSVCVHTNANTDQSKRTSFTDYALSVRFGARQLDEALGEQQQVIVGCDTRYDLAVACVSIWLSGRTAVLPANLSDSAIQQAMSICDGPNYIANTVLPGFDHPPIRIQPPSHEETAAANKGSNELVINASRLLAVLFTSGTTGSFVATPKYGYQLIGEACTLVETFGLRNSSDVEPSPVLSTVPAHHIYGLLFSIVVPLMSGRAFIDETPLHHEHIASIVEQTKPGIIVSVPAHLRNWPQSEEKILDHKPKLFSSSAPLPALAWEQLRHWSGGVETVSVLGSTETGGIAWRATASGSWQTFPGVQVDATNTGAMLLTSPLLAPSDESPLELPDRIELVQPSEGSSSQRFQHFGRTDGVIKIGGKRVSLQHIEAAMSELAGIAESKVIAVKTDSHRQNEIWVVAALTGASTGRATDGKEWTLAKLRSDLAKTFDRTLLPRRARFVASLPRETTGKLTRKKIMDLFSDSKPESETSQFRTLSKQLTGADPACPDSCEFTLEVPRTLWYFKGHFEDHPILPGVALLEALVCERVAQVWPELGEPQAIRRLKFRKAIRPEATIALTLTRSEKGVNFLVTEKQDTSASGTLVFTPRQTNEDLAPNV